MYWIVQILLYVHEHSDPYSIQQFMDQQLKGFRVFSGIPAEVDLPSIVYDIVL